MLVAGLATLLAGDATSDAARLGNNLAIIAVSVDGGFAARADQLAEYIRSSRPADPRRPVLMPGDPERDAAMRAGGVRVDPPIWEALAAVAEARGVELPQTR